MTKGKKSGDKGGIERLLLKIMLGTYIVLCIVIAGLNYGYAPNADRETAEFIAWFWHFYENWIKTIFIISGSYLTVRIARKSKGTSRMRYNNLVGFILSALAVHILLPLLLGNKELYFFTMPLPWTTTPIQLLEPASSFYASRIPVWGLSGIKAALVFYVVFSMVVIGGTLIMGRRWQCSKLCLFNGFAAEVFAPAIPLVGKKRKITSRMLKVLRVVRYFFFGAALFFTIWWVLYLLGVSVPGEMEVISMTENYKYLTTELLMILFFWTAFIGRGYCYYCPLGTLLGWISRLAGQRIRTDNTNCIQCGQCNLVCPMTIDIKSRAAEGKSVKELRCVGCGHCIDACPTKTLSYKTRFTEKFGGR